MRTCTQFLLLLFVGVALLAALGILLSSQRWPRQTSSRPGISIDSFDDSRSVWHNGDPGTRGKGGSWRLEAGRLTVVPAPGLDYWARTFYKPLLIKNDAQVLATKHVCR